jgi:hypothetical protein
MELKKGQDALAGLANLCRRGSTIHALCSLIDSINPAPASQGQQAGGARQRRARGAAHHAKHHYAGALKKSVQACAVSRGQMNELESLGQDGRDNSPADTEDDVQKSASDAAASSAPTNILTWRPRVSA